MSRAARTTPARTRPSPTIVAATGTARSAKAQRHAGGWPSARLSCWRSGTSTSFTLCRREAELLPVEYFHVVYTLPAQLRDIAYQNKRVIYHLLMKASAEATLA